MVAIRNPKNLRNLADVTQPGGLGLPDQGVPVLHSSNSSFVIQTIAGGTGGGAFSLGASNLGNTLGQTGVTGSRIVLAGIGNITLSQLTDLNGGTISISAGTAAGAAFSAGVSGGNTAGDTGATGTRLVFAGGQSVTLSQATDANGGTITISGASTSQSVQTQNMIAATAAGNTSGVLALVSSGTLTLAGGNSITLSQNGNAITISGATTSQSVQTQNLHNLTLSGNTAGVMAQISSGTLTLAGGNNITLSQNGNAVTISGAAAGGAQTAISGIAASNTTYTSGTVTITGVGGGVTVSSNTGQRIDISVAAPVAQTNQAGSVFAVGNTTSSTSGTYDARTLSLRGDGIISIAATNSGFRISATQSNDSGGVYAVGNTYSSSSGTFDVRTMSLRGDGIISIAATNSGFRISASQSVQPETQTFLGGLANSQTTYTSGTVGLSELGAITIRSTTGNQFQLSVNAQTTQTQNLHNVTISGNTSGALAAISSGTMTLAGGNNITLSQAGNAITISGANVGGAQTGISGIAASNTTYTSGSVTFTGVGGGVTVSSNTGQRIDISVAAPVAQTNQAGSIYAIGNTTSSTSGTYDARTLSISGAGIISVAATNSGWKISANAQTGISSIVASDATYTSGSVQFTGSGIVTVRSSANQRVVIDASQSVQTQGQMSAGVSNIGNTLGDTGVSGTRMVLAGIGAVTLSQSTNANGNTVSISAPAQTVQTQNMVAVTLSGNTSGAQALISSGTLTLAGGNNITVSQAGNAVTISGANVGGAQTGISGIANSQTTYTSGTVSMSELGAITIRSTTGNQYQFSVNAQSVQPETQTFVGGLANSQTTYTSGTISMSELGAITIRSTTGNQYQFSVNAQSTQPGVQHFVVSNTTFSSGTVSISGFGDVTVNTAANMIRISAPVQTAQTGISGIANSQTTYTSGTVSLSELGAITIRSTTGNQYQFSVNAQTEQTQSRFNLTISGNTAGAGALVSSGVMTLAGGNNVTLSQAGNAITISGGAGGAFSAGVSTGGNTAGDTGVTGSRLVFVGTNNITLSQATAAAGGTVTISGPTTVAQTNQSGGAYAVGNTYSSSSGTFDARTLSIRGDGIISVAATNSGWRISASQSVQAETQTFVGGLAASNTTYTSGTITITGVGGGVTVSSNTGQRIDISVAAPVAQTNQSGGVYAVGNTYSSSSGTIDARTISLRGDGIISIAATNSGWRISASQSVQPETQTFLGGISLSGNTAGAMALISSGTMNLAGGNNITLSQNGQSVTISGGAGGAFSAGVSTGGNTQGNTGVTGSRLVIVGTNNITLSQNTDANGATISISGQSPAGGAFSGGVSNLGNTAGATGISGTQMVLVGSGVMSLSQTTGANGNTVSILAPAASAISAVAPLSTSTAGSTISILGPATSSLSAVSGIKISTNGSTISVGYGMPLADWENMPRAQASLLSLALNFSKTPIYWNDIIGGDLTVKSLAFAISMVTASQPLSVSAHLGVYRLVNSTSASLLGSVSEAYVVSSASSVSLSGVRNIVMTGIGTHTALSNLTGGEYLLGMMFSATATNAMNFSILGASGGAGPLGGIYPGTNQLSTATNQGIQVMNGRGSTTVNAMPANVSSADLINQGTGASMALHPWIYIRS